MNEQGQEPDYSDAGEGDRPPREGVEVGLILADGLGHILHIDDTAALLMGLESGQAQTTRLAAWPSFERSLLDESGEPLPIEESPIRLAAERGKAVHDRVVILPSPEDKPFRLLQLSAEPLQAGAGGISGLVLIMVDVTPLRLAASGAARLLADGAATPTDSGALEDRLMEMISQAQIDQGSLAVLALGVDRFKNVHDSLGHAVTEQLQLLIAERLLRDLREGDSVARTGEGDFVLLLSGTGSSTDVARAVERLKANFDRRWELAGEELFLTPSIGIAVFPDDGEDAPTLLRNAAKAMRLAQTAGGNTWQFFHESTDATSAERLGQESALHRALELGHFILDFQPQIDSYSGAVVGVEALLRWKDPERGIIPPNDFIPLAEETGLMLPIGAWVLEEACRQAILWNSDPDDPVGVRMAVNISPRQFEQQDIVGLVRTSLEDTGLPAHLLEIEITESMAIADPERTISLLNGLKELGVRVALDDFGTGYSSLSHLARLPIDTVKIDRSFVSKLEDAREHIVIATSVIALGHRLGLTVVAEGVETHEQAAFLGNEACDLLQGYLFSKPVSPEKCSDLIGGESAFAAMLEEAAERLAVLMSSGGFGKQ